MAKRQPNLAAADFWLLFLDQRIDSLTTFSLLLRGMDGWPEGIRPVHLADQIDELMGGATGYTIGVRMAIHGEEI